LTALSAKRTRPALRGDRGGDAAPALFARVGISRCRNGSTSGFLTGHAPVDLFSSKCAPSSESSLAFQGPLESRGKGKRDSFPFSWMILANRKSSFIVDEMLILPSAAWPRIHTSAS